MSASESRGSGVVTSQLKENETSDSTKEELWLGIANIAAAEEHCIEVCSKTENNDLRADLRKLSDDMRDVRQSLVTCGVVK